MTNIKLFGVSIIAAFMLTACGGNGGLGGPLAGPNDVHRGEADAINPARNVTVICEKDKNGNTTNVTTNIINNCNKNNPVDASSSSTSADDHSSQSSTTNPTPAP